MKGRRLGDFCLFAGRLAAKVQSYAAITSVIPLLMKFPSPPLPSPPHSCSPFPRRLINT